MLINASNILYTKGITIPYIKIKNDHNKKKKQAHIVNKIFLWYVKCGYI